MNHASIICAYIIGLCAMTASHRALNRADESDRRAAAIELRMVEVESVLTLEQKAALDMVRVKQ